MKKRSSSHISFMTFYKLILVKLSTKTMIQFIQVCHYKSCCEHIILYNLLSIFITGSNNEIVDPYQQKCGFIFCFLMWGFSILFQFLTDCFKPYNDFSSFYTNFSFALDLNHLVSPRKFHNLLVQVGSSDIRFKFSFSFTTFCNDTGLISIALKLPLLSYFRSNWKLKVLFK